MNEPTTYEGWCEMKPIDWTRPGFVRQSHTIVEEYLNYLRLSYWQSRPNTGEIDFLVSSQADADNLHTALQRYYMNPATHTPVEPPKPVEDPFLNHYL